MAASLEKSNQVEVQQETTDCGDSGCNKSDNNSSSNNSSNNNNNSNSNNNNNKSKDSPRVRRHLVNTKKTDNSDDKNCVGASPKMTKRNKRATVMTVILVATFPLLLNVMGIQIQIWTTGVNGGNDSPDSSPIPGPRGLPCYGSMLAWKGPQTNLAWTKQFGPIYKVKMGSKSLVYLNTAELIEKYMEGRNGESYLDRPMGPGAIAEGLLFGSGEAWKKNKKAFMTALHTVTFEAHMEHTIQEEITLVMENLHKNTDKDIKLGDFLLSACINVIPGLLLGESLPRDSQDRVDLMRVAHNMEGVDLTSMFTAMSLKHPKWGEFLSKLMPHSFVDIHKTSRSLQNLLRSWIRDVLGNPLTPTSPRLHTFNQQEQSQTEEDSTDGICPFRRSSKKIKVTNVENGNNGQQAEADQEESPLTPPRKGDVDDYTMKNASLVAFGFTNIGPGEQAYEETEPPLELASPLSPITEHQWTFDRQMSMNLGKESILQRILKQPAFANVTEGTDAELLQSLIDMFFGGVTSTLAALEFIFVHLVKNRDYQRRAQQEVDQVLSKHGGLVTWSLKKDMPYVRGCITEALRLGAVTPSSLPHVATKDTEIDGYSIPTGTFVMASIYSLHYDPYYLDPHVFRPQRHLKPNGEYKQPSSAHFKPYGVGARRCVGASMAEMQLFVYTVNILRHFELEPISKDLPSLDTHMRIINRLKDFRCVLRKREV